MSSAKSRAHRKPKGELVEVGGIPAAVAQLSAKPRERPRSTAPRKAANNRLARRLDSEDPDGLAAARTKQDDPAYGSDLTLVTTSDPRGTETTDALDETQWADIADPLHGEAASIAGGGTRTGTGVGVGAGAGVGAGTGGGASAWGSASGRDTWSGGADPEDLLDSVVRRSSGLDSGMLRDEARVAERDRHGPRTSGVDMSMLPHGEDDTAFMSVETL